MALGKQNKAGHVFEGGLGLQAKSTSEARDGTWGML
jgi:hypothetical protein